MAKFIEATTKDGKKVTINIDFLVSFKAIGEFTTLSTIVPTSNFTIRSSYEEFKKLVEGAASK